VHHGGGGAVRAPELRLGGGVTRINLSPFFRRGIGAEKILVELLR